MNPQQFIILQEQNELSHRQSIEILEYCKKNIQYMWAAYISGIILECDFRDVTEMKIEEYISSYT